MSTSVLIVDDDPDVLALLKVAFLVDGRFAGACLAPSAEEAMANMKRPCGKSCPDVIVLDHQMPGLTGAQAVGPFRELCPRATIIMYSASVGVTLPAKDDVLADLYLDKSVTAPAMVDQVAEHMQLN
jgi:two-component system nitrogen regulation response regulator GlnG